MKVKNYLVLKNYNITDLFFLYSDMELVKSRYQRMQDILIESAKLYLQDCDEIIVDTLTVQNDQQMFKHHMQVIKHRYHSEPCNILYCDLDTVFIKPFEVFNKYDSFSMCNGNCGVRYYPHGGVPDILWAIQDKMSQYWDTDNTDYRIHVSKWDYEQFVYNKMLNQALHLGKIEGRHNNPFNNALIHNMYNHYAGAGLIHCCGTTQQFDSIMLMEQLLGLAKLQKYDDIRELLSQQLYTEFLTDIKNNNKGLPTHNPWNKSNQ